MATTTPPSSSEYLPANTTLQNVAYLIGHPIAHSSSPSLHDSISASTSFPYRQILVESTDLPASSPTSATTTPVPHAC